MHTRRYRERYGAISDETHYTLPPMSVFFDPCYFLPCDFSPLSSYLFVFSPPIFPSDESCAVSLQVYTLSISLDEFSQRKLSFSHDIIQPMVVQKNGKVTMICDTYFKCKQGDNSSCCVGKICWSGGKRALIFSLSLESRENT